MRLIPRFVAGTLVIVGALGSTVVLAGDARERRTAREGEASRLEHEAALVSSWWQRQQGAPGGVAEEAARTLGIHVVLIGRDGVRVADSDARTAEPLDAERLGNRPEVAAALSGVRGVAQRADRADGRTRLYVAVPASGGVVRLDRDVDDIAALASDGRRDLVLTAAIALALAGLFAYVIAAGVARPVIGLRDTARALAGGDLSRRPTLSAPGELGELANALHRLAEALSTQVAAHTAEDAFVNATLEALHEGVVAVDARANVVRVNETARRLLGSRDELPFASELLPRDRALREALSVALAGVPTDPVETTLGDRTLALAARPLAQGGAVLAVLDLTAQRRLETIRRDFVANVSHELKTPLTVVSGFADTLLDPDLPAPVRQQFAETIRTHATRMQRIVDDLLDLSRIESGGWIPNPTELDLASLAPDATSVAAEKADRLGVTLDIALAPGAERAWADATAMRQVLSNLADNAVRHTATGRIAVFAELEDGGVTVGVRDTGSGIPAEHLGRIFERFYRVDPGRSREQGGTGLGLAIVRHLVEAHGGRVHAESTVGQGTTISCWFPAPGHRAT